MTKYDYKITCVNEAACKLISSYLARYFKKNNIWQEKCHYQMRENVLYIRTNGFDDVKKYCKRFDCVLNHVFFNYMNNWYRIKK